MGSLSTESFEQFLDSLKKAGIAISNEVELRERLAEAGRDRCAEFRWRDKLDIVHDALEDATVRKRTHARSAVESLTPSRS